MPTLRKVLALALIILSIAASAPSQAGVTLERFVVPLPDGTQLSACLRRDPSQGARPILMEYSSYATSVGADCSIPDVVPEDLVGDVTFVAVNARGTGASSGSWDAFGPVDQQDIYDTLEWVSHQSWSNGKAALIGFSGPAIYSMVALRKPHPSLVTVIPRAGTWDLYRDQAYIGGILNDGGIMLHESLVLAGYTTWGRAVGDRARRASASQAAAFASAYPTVATQRYDSSFYRDRSPAWAPVAPIPILFNSGWYDWLGGRAGLEAFEATKQFGSQIAFFGGHQGDVPWMLDKWFPLVRRWVRHYLLFEDNGIDRENPVHLFIPNGADPANKAGDGIFTNAADLPMPGTLWQKLYLRSGPSGSARSLNDGVLSSEEPGTEDADSLPAIPSPGNRGFNDWGPVVNTRGDMQYSDAQGFTYSTEAFAGDVTLAGPMALLLHASATAPEVDFVVNVSDVYPNGATHVVARGRLRSSHRAVDPARSRFTTSGDMFQPWHVHDEAVLQPIGQVQDYQIELWPSANTFKAGHRLRLQIHALEVSDTRYPTAPALLTIEHSMLKPSRLLVPWVSLAE